MPQSLRQPPVGTSFDQVHAESWESWPAHPCLLLEQLCPESRGCSHKPPTGAAQSLARPREREQPGHQAWLARTGGALGGQQTAKFMGGQEAGPDRGPQGQTAGPRASSQSWVGILRSQEPPSRAWGPTRALWPSLHRGEWMGGPCCVHRGDDRGHCQT